MNYSNVYLECALDSDYDRYELFCCEPIVLTEHFVPKYLSKHAAFYVYKHRKCKGRNVTSIEIRHNNDESPDAWNTLKYVIINVD